MSLPTAGDRIGVDAQILPGAALTDTLWAVDLSQMAAQQKTDYFADVNSSDGTRGRAANISDIELPTDPVDFDDSGETGVIVGKYTGTLPTSGTVRIWLYPPNTRNTSYGASDTYGSDNVYRTAIRGYYPNGAGTDRTVNGNDLSNNGSLSVGGITGATGAATQYNGSTQWADVAQSDITSKPLSMFAMALPDNTSANYGIAGLYDTGATTIFTLFEQNIALGRLFDRNGTVVQVNGGTLSTSVWNTAGLICISDSSRKISLNGASFVTNTTTITTTTTLNNFAIGRYNDSTPANNFPGAVQHVLFFAEEIDEEESDHLSAMYSDQSTFWGNWQTETLVPGAEADPDDLVQGEIVFESPTVSKDLVLPDNTLYVLAMGQSNMLGRDTTGSKSVNSGIEIANTSSSSLEVWDLTSNPAQNTIPDPSVGSSGPILNADCPTWYFADKIADTYGVDVKILFVAWGGVAISHFEEPSGAMWSEFEDQMTTFASDFPRIDMVLWLQGESDSGSPTYETDYTNTIADYRTNAKVPSNVPWIASELLQTYTGINADLKAVSDVDANVWTTSSVGLSDDGGGVHFDSASLIEIGDTLWASAFVEAIPTINENSSIAIPDDLVHGGIVFGRPRAGEEVAAMGAAIGALFNQIYKIQEED